MNAASEKTNSKRKWIIYLILFAETAFLTYLTWKHGNQRLTSDDSGEMILANLLSRTGGIMSRNWYYSSELRIINTQIIMSILFRFISDWHVVRTVGTAIHLALLCASFLYFCHSTDLGKKLFWFSPLILWPISYPYMDIVLFGLHYIAHLIFIFISLGLFLNPDPGGKMIRTIILICLSFAAGLVGIRMLAVCYAPLFMAGMISFLPFSKHKTDKKTAAAAAAALFSCIAGYLINSKILLRIYSVQREPVRFTFPKPGNVWEIISGTLNVMGGTGKMSLLRTLFTLSVGVMVLLLVLMFIRIILGWNSNSQEIRFLLPFFAFSYLATAAGALFTSQSFAPRYLIMPCIGFIVILAAFAERFSVNTLLNRGIFGYILTVILAAGLIQTHNFIHYDDIGSKKAAYQYIMDSGLEFGFGDWGAADDLTELSSGKIHFCKFINYLHPYVWYYLMEKDFTKYAEGKPVFLLMKNDRFNFSGNIGFVFGEWTEDELKYLKEGTIVFKDDDYTIRKYDSLEQFASAAGLSFQ